MERFAVDTSQSVHESTRFSLVERPSGFPTNNHPVNIRQIDARERTDRRFAEKKANGGRNFPQIIDARQDARVLDAYPHPNVCWPVNRSSVMPPFRSFSMKPRLSSNALMPRVLRREALTKLHGDLDRGHVDQEIDQARAAVGSLDREEMRQTRSATLDCGQHLCFE